MFKLKAPFKETPAQKEAIEKLVEKFKNWTKAPRPFGCHRLWKDVFGCKGD